MTCRTMGKPLALALVAFLAFEASSARAEGEANSPSVAVELNNAASTETGCLLTFVVRNTLATEVQSLVLETVMFDTSGQVNLLTLFDFGAIPPAVPRVRQFEVPALQCEALASVLVNGVQTCTGGEAEGADCRGALKTISKADVELIG